MRVTLIQRRPFPGQFSVEGIFDRTVHAMRSIAPDACIRQVLVPFHTRGVWRRLANAVYSRSLTSDVWHVTGDIHYAAIGLESRRTVVTVHDCHALERLKGWRRKILRLFWYQLPLRNAAAITVVSTETKHQLLQHMPSLDPLRIHVIPVSVSDIYQPTPKPFNADCPKILQIGTKRNKNLPRLIEALRPLSCQLIIVGHLDSELVDLLSRASIDYENYVGLTDNELLAQYQQCDLVSFVSTYEGFGMPIIEAQFIERPVVTSNCSSMSEVAGDAACLVDPLDVSAIRMGIERVIHDAAYREQLIEKGRTNRRRFDTWKIAQRYVDIYRMVASRDER